MSYNSQSGWARCPFVMACDEAYAMPLTTTLRSLVEANGSDWPLEVYVVSDFSKRTRSKVAASLPKGSVSFRWITADLAPFRNFRTNPQITKMTYARLLIPSVVAADVSRVIYLDGDILVLDNLEPLRETDLRGAVVGAVLDDLDQEIRRGTSGLEEVPRVDRYFNAGVLLIDLDKWRSEQITGKTLEYLARYPHSPFSDQDALNVVCNGNWFELDPRWNFQDLAKRLRRCETSLASLSRTQLPGIVHFVTRFKPWDVSALSVNERYYDSFRSRTQFARTRRQKLDDLLMRWWYRTKLALRPYPFFRFAWTQMKALRSHL